MHQLMLNLMTVTDQHSSQGTNSADTPAKLNAPTDVNLKDCSQSISSKETHLPN